MHRKSSFGPLGKCFVSVGRCLVSIQPGKGSRRHGNEQDNLAEALDSSMEQSGAEPSGSSEEQPGVKASDNAGQTPAEASDNSTKQPGVKASGSSTEQSGAEYSGSSGEQLSLKASDNAKQPVADAPVSSAEQALANEPENFDPNPDSIELSDLGAGPDVVPDIPQYGVAPPATAQQATETRQSVVNHLQNQLFTALIGRPGSPSFFLPEDSKGAIITHSAIQEQCQFGPTGRIDLHDAEKVHKIGRDLFAILGFVGEASEVCAFIKEGLTDADLPFYVSGPTHILTRQNGAEIQSARDWPPATRFNFYQHQWSILTPRFSDQAHYVFHESTILPFTHKKRVSHGAYSEVYEANIHPAHHEWDQGPVQSTLEVAIKKLLDHNEEDFEKERNILVAIEAKQNNHLVKLLFSYEYKGSYHLVFLRAKGNLRNFWEQNPHPQFTLDTVLWSLRQMIGITQGLRIIHTFEVSNPIPVTEIEMETPQGKAKMSVSSGEERYGRHGDLKPENILWFSDPAGAICQITDFGLGRFHGRDTRTKAAPYTIWSSPTYEPPECHIYLPVSRAYDLWSLGCMFLEWVSWMLNGWQAIDDFSRSRVEQSFIMNQEGVISDDYFWSLVIEGNKRDARVRNGVEQWVLNLRAHPRCSRLIHDILNIIMQDLLCIVPSLRSNAASLHNNLNGLFSRVEGDYEYALNPCPWVPKTSSTHRRRSIFVVTIADPGSSGISLLRSETWPTRQLLKHQTGKRDRHQLDATHTTSSHVAKSRRKSRRASDLWQRVFNGIDRGILQDAVLNPGKPIDGLHSQVNFRYGRCIMTS